jgi:hypothetical protein
MSQHDLSVILYVIAALCFTLATFGRLPVGFNLVPLGLLAWVLVPLITTAF